MRCYAALVLATISVGQAFAASIAHVHGAHHHAKKSPAAIPTANIETNIETRDMEKRNVLTSADAGRLSSMGVAATGINAYSNNGNVWIGSDGPYTNTFSNSAGSDLILVIWGPQGSWINAIQPLITHSLPAGGPSVTISFASGAIGAWSAIYPETTMSNGQISNTWGEYTFSPMGVVDVSREVNMNGRAMSIQGPQCKSDMSTCVFVCSSGDVCMTGYLLQNCDNGSQPGATYGMYGDSPSGGCGWLGAGSASLSTTFS